LGLSKNLLLRANLLKGGDAESSGCGFVRDENSKGQGTKGEGLSFMLMLIITLTAIAVARRFSNRFSYNL
jgi:hypothetical protein